MATRPIKIFNRTGYQDRHLRAFVVRAADEILGDTDLRPLRVTFYRVRGRSWGCSGRAYLNSGTFKVGLPWTASPDRIDLAHVVAHELGHCKGLEHREMKGAMYSRVGRWRELYAWGEALPLELKAKHRREREPRVRITGLPLAEKGLARAEARLADLDREVKRLLASRKKWAGKVAYYRRRIALLTAQAAEAAH
jgi:hypothetical protein